MRAFAQWVLGRRHWLVFLVIAFPPFACALLVADGARQGPARALPIAGIALASVLLLAATGGSVGVASIVGVAAVVAGFLLGWLLYRSRSLEIAFQATILVALIGAVLLGLIGPAPAELAAPFIEQLVTAMELMGGTPAQLAAIRDADPAPILGLLFAAGVANILAALMAGCWLLGFVEPGVAFGRQFAALRLGRIVGILALVVVTASLALRWPAVQYATSMAVIGFLFQGLAVMHAWLQAKDVHNAVVAAIYLSIVTPLGEIVIIALCSAGLLDNFFALRRPLRR